MNTTPPPTGIPAAETLPKYLHENEAVKLYRISKRWLLKMRVEGLLPFTKVAGKVYYRPADLVALFDEQYTGTAA